MKNRKLKLTALFLLHFITSPIFAQNEKPSLVVGIVVDQMRQEYIYRYWDGFGEKGFKRLIKEGFMVENAHYNYVPTVTGPGHASVYTGSTPAVHGILGNSWFDRNSNTVINCVYDSSQLKLVGAEKGAAQSPANLLAMTVTDQLRVSSQMKSKVISISIKDRGAILPGGHTANLALWYNDTEGNFVTSTHYVQSLPKWAADFNASGRAAYYMKQTWNTLHPLSFYTASQPDDSPYEALIGNKTKPVFPYDLPNMGSKGFGLINYTPFGNDILTELALAAQRGERLGQSGQTDFLAISYSSTDIAGHNFGPHSVEIQDMYLRLDQNIAQLLAHLDKTVGKGKYTVFLSSDHGVADVAQQNIDRKIPAGYLTSTIKKTVTDYLVSEYGSPDWLLDVYGGQVFLDRKKVPVDKLPEVRSRLALVIGQDPQVYMAWSADELNQGSYGENGLKGMVIRGFHPSRSGDVAYLHYQGWLGGSNRTGTSHGTGYSYDTHVPMLFFGFGIKKGSTHEYHPITDIAPTISAILGIPPPDSATGNPVVDALR